MSCSYDKLDMYIKHVTLITTTGLALVIGHLALHGTNNPPLPDSRCHRPDNTVTVISKYKLFSSAH